MEWLNFETCDFIYKVTFPLLLNRSAAVSQTSRSKFECAAAGFQHSRAPFRGSMREFFRGILTPAFPFGERVKLYLVFRSAGVFALDPASGTHAFFRRDGWEHL